MIIMTIIMIIKVFLYIRCCLTGPFKAHAHTLTRSHKYPHTQIHFSVSSTAIRLEKKKFSASDFSLSVTVIVQSAEDSSAMFFLC